MLFGSRSAEWIDCFGSVDLAAVSNAMLLHIIGLG